MNIKSIIKEEIVRFLGGVSEGKMKRVTKSMWKKMKEDDRVNALLSAFKDPDDAEEHWESDWEDLPSQASHMYVYEGKLTEAVKPIKLSGNLKKDLKTVILMAEKMVKYAKDNFNTYIPTGEKLSQLRIGGVREKDVLEYNIRHLVKAINTDLKKKYMKDFVAEGKLNEHEVIFSKGEMATLHKDGKLVKKDDEGKDHTYIFTDEGKVNEATPAKVQKAQKELVTTIELLKKNFPLYKSAMESGDEKKLEKHRKIALDLTKKKKQLEKSLELELQGLYANAELKLENVGDDTWKSFLGDDPAFKLYTATNTEKRKTVQARKTNKTWDDGVPVLKYIARDSKKDHPLPKGKFKIIEDNKHGWWYYNIGSTWYGIQQKDYGTPPFEY